MTARSGDAPSDVEVAGWVPVVGGTVGIVSGIVSGVTGLRWEIAAAAGLVLGAIGGPVGVWDLRARRIPDRLVVVGLGAVAVVVIVADLGGAGVSVWAIVGGVLATALPLLVVHLVSPAGLGFGDVKYAVVVGAGFAVVDWRLGATAVVLACAAGTFGAGVARSWRRSIPFGSCLAASSMITMAAARLLV